jgi:tripartite motif-containing protein 2/3/tripartite motif-containing protein 71
VVRVGAGLYNPIGVAIDTSDMVYVSEWGNLCVSVFTSEGQFVMTFGMRGKGPGEFEHPYGLSVDNSGVVYVYRDNNRVQVF